jgi:DNA primase
MDEVEEIKRRIDIVEFISSYLTVKKAGANYRALCPFHHEKSPSMMISPEKQIFKCFGCGEGGDVLTFVMKMENLGFREALEMLAARAGVKLEKYRQSPEYEKEKDQKTRLYQINGWSARLFHEILLKHPSGKAALDYLKGRGLTMETIETFGIGYAPQSAGYAPSNAILKQFLEKKGFSPQEVREAGGPDRFYKRIIFPIRDVMGNVLGFTGRVMEKGQEPKYLNTPETIIFHKGRILYNLDKARGEIKLAKATVVVEGQMDVIASWQAGVKNVVATSGTALTEDHLRTLYRYTPNIIFSFDSDTAGLATSKKAYEMAIAEGMNVRMANLAEFKDPGEMVASDPELWQMAVEEAQPVIDWYFRIAFSRQKVSGGGEKELTPQDKKEIAKELIPIIKKIPDSIEQAHYVGVLARKLRVAETVIFEALGKVTDQNSSSGARNVKQTPNTNIKIAKLSDQEILIGLLTLSPQNMEKAVAKIKPEYLSGAPELLYTHLISWYNSGRTDKLGDFLKLNLKPQEYQDLEMLQIELEAEYPNIDPVIDDLLANFKAHQQEKIKQFYASAIAEAEEKGDREKLKQLVKEFQNAISK